MKPLPRIIFTLLATAVAPGITFNGMNALWHAFDPHSRGAVLPAIFNSAAFDLFLISLPLAVAFTLAILWWEKKFETLDFSDYLFGGCLCGVVCFVITFSLILNTQMSRIERIVGDYTVLMITQAAGIFVGLLVMYQLRPLDRRISQTKPVTREKNP
ncbi:MAG: hypothetical protein ACYC6A_12405 [Armatimonadota bacterium]